MINKYYGLIVLVLVLGGIIGAYCLFSNGDYYENYRLQSTCVESALESSLSAMAPLMLQAFGSTDALSSMELSSAKLSNDTSLENAKMNATMALEYQQKMLNSAKTDSEKKYAEVLINQSKALMSYIDLIKELETNKDNKGKRKEIMGKLEGFSNETQNYQTELENIKNNDHVFKNRLKEEDKKVTDK